jgi:DNA-binding transcriptional regulator YhcF (GntR family)
MSGMPADLQPNPDEPRALFRRIVDDIISKIETGELYPHAPLPSARKMADLYGVAVMTAQRALKEMQHQRLTYSIAGKGTFVHPDTFDARRTAELQKAFTDPAFTLRVATYLQRQHEIIARYTQADSTKDRNAAQRDLMAHALNHDTLIADVVQHIPDPSAPKPRRTGPDFRTLEVTD